MIYFVFLSSSQTLHILWMIENRHIEKGVYWRFGFDVLKSWKNFTIVCQKQSNVNAPLVVYTYHLYIHISVGSALLVSTDMAISRSHRTWSEWQCRASRFFHVKDNNLLRIKKPIVKEKMNDFNIHNNKIFWFSPF